MPGRVHVIGAGLSGLAAAVALTLAGRPVTVYEAAGHAGGRCRSFFDDKLRRRIDNGNHLLLSGNIAANAYLASIGAEDRLAGPEQAVFPFVDLRTGERWIVRPNAGWFPWWVFDRQRRIPGTRATQYLSGVRLARVGRTTTVAKCLNTNSTMFRRFWEPLTVAALNTSAEEAAAALLWPVLRQTFGRGEAACRPRVARDGLSETLIDPAIEMLRRRGAIVRLRARVRRLELAGDTAVALDLGEDTPIEIAHDDAVVVAVPPAAAAALLPMVTVPTQSRAIVNGHFLLGQSSADVRVIGLIGGLAQWVFVRGDLASVTVSAADRLVDEASERLAARMWSEIGRVLDLGDAPMLEYRIVKEKRATFAQTPAQLMLRPGCRTPVHNVFLAGDWTDTGLPATIEGSVLSGHTAALSVCRATAGA